MTTAHDVAAYVLQKCGEMTAMKLQKLVYYSQAWSLVWDDRPLFDERIEAWANGPVVPKLYARHRGEFQVRTWTYGDPSNIDQDGQETIDAVVDYYGNKSAHELSLLTHAEAPWSDARGTARPGERCTDEITKAAMAEYYGSLVGMGTGEKV